MHAVTGARSAAAAASDVTDIYDQGASAYEALWRPVILPPAAVPIRSLRLHGRCTLADVPMGTVNS